ncbi:alpha/beta fold hydrolase [Roseomonas sp. 18066]|uniref:alpha/beta fold hydrolase n=1 Tax=Roseomonas sp. 18066 TaxID=2681412 RepID=UPI001358AB7B|nr:alpha/beta fold hydrolase [Roseomonas sp. 18066]
MPWIDVNGVALRYQDSGAGEIPLVLLHEMGGTLESWDFLVPLLPPRLRVLRLDLRGAGLSEKPVAPFTMEDLGQDVLALCDALGLVAPIVPMGCAVGGALALHLAARHPARMRAVIATSPATSVVAERKEALRARADELERRGARALTDAGLERGYPTVLRDDAARFALTRAQRMAADPQGFAGTMRMLADLDMEAELGRIACPALLLAGTHDQDRPPEGVRAVAARIPGAEFRELPSGHFMAIQTPALVAEAMLRFLG